MRGAWAFETDLLIERILVGGEQSSETEGASGAPLWEIGGWSYLRTFEGTFLTSLTPVIQDVSHI